MSTLLPSDITKHQSIIMYPEVPNKSGPIITTLNAQGLDPMVTFISQLRLRVILNQAQSSLYGTSE
jgi:hypothetical protein